MGSILLLLLKCLGHIQWKKPEWCSIVEKYQCIGKGTCLATVVRNLCVPPAQSSGIFFQFSWRQQTLDVLSCPTYSKNVMSFSNLSVSPQTTPSPVWVLLLPSLRLQLPPWSYTANTRRVTSFVFLCVCVEHDWNHEGSSSSRDEIRQIGEGPG